MKNAVAGTGHVGLPNGVSKVDLWILDRGNLR